MTRLAIVGAGYVGLVNAAHLAALGHEVTVVETDRTKLLALRRGTVDVSEPDLAALLAEGMARGRLEVTADCRTAARGATMLLIAVQTPLGVGGTHELAHVHAAIDALLPYAEPQAAVVILSTVPPGTTDAVQERLVRGGRSDLRVAVLPEFFREGRALEDARHPARVIVGSRDPALGRALAGLWRREDVPVVLTDPPTAELAKLASNAFLATRISFINEVADYAARVGADARVVARAMGLDPRIGPEYLTAGIGFGGSCLPKDLAGLAAQVRSAGGEPRVTAAALEVNRDRPAEVRRLLSARLADRAAVVAVLGIAFKPGTSDRRDSAAVALVRDLAHHGYRVRACDPSVGPWEAASVARELGGGVSVTDAGSALDGADAMILATEWPEYVMLDWTDVAERMRGSLVVDGRSALDAETVSAAGLDYAAIGCA